MKNLELLKIQSDLGIDWAFSDKKSVFNEAVKIINVVNKTLDNVSNNQFTAMPPKPKKVIPSEQPSNSNFNLVDNKSTEEWIKIAKKLADKAKNLDELRVAVQNFEGLSIKKTATNCVFSDGNPSAKIMFIGEAPGENEDLKGIPFCGVSGRLLDEMIKHVGFTRAGDSEKNSFYITNSIFWRPPGNRKPTPEEIAICKPFVEKHIALINPKVIVLVGATATYSVLSSKESISVVRSSMQKYNNPELKSEIGCFAVYHPSFLLRQPSQKKNSWFDLLKIKKYFESI